MQKLFASTIAALLLGVLAGPAWPVGIERAPAQKAFPSLTTIYVIPGVRDDGGAANAGTASIVQCSNVSGAEVSVRVLALNSFNMVRADVTRSIPHGATRTFATHLVNSYNEINLNAPSLLQGVFNIEATHPSVFCTASTIGAANSVPAGVSLHAVRVNSPPGTLELRGSSRSSSAIGRKPEVEGQNAVRLSAAARRRAFPNLTTIYVVPGVRDNGAADDAGLATSVHCSNVSGGMATVRLVALYSGGSVAADESTTLINGGTETFSTHLTRGYADDVVLATGSIDSGTFNIEATNPAVFCSAVVHNAGDVVPIGVALRMIRVNPQPGTQE